MYFFQMDIPVIIHEKNMLDSKPKSPPRRKEYFRQIKKGRKNNKRGGLKLTAIPIKKPLIILLYLNVWFKKNQAIDNIKT